eukprot:IDg17218t1
MQPARTTVLYRYLQQSPQFTRCALRRHYDFIMISPANAACLALWAMARAIMDRIAGVLCEKIISRATAAPFALRAPRYPSLNTA